MKNALTLFLLFFIPCIVYAKDYTNPIVYEDYSDPDVIRVGEDYWLTASSFHCWPGLPILHSYDLVHWEVVNHAIKGEIPGGVGNVAVEHGNQVWAPAIRYHQGMYYITWGDPDVGIYQVHTTDPRGEWSAPHLIIEAKGYIDACPFWDEDGKTYIVHAMARSRSGVKSVIRLMEVDAQLTHALRPSEWIYDGHETQPTCEGPKMYKKDGYYYIFFPAGGVPTGWQTVIRSKQLYQGWEEKIVMTQGASSTNGPHQGGWVSTPNGEDWFIHFQDVGPLGRILHLQPMQWRSDGWPVIGVDKDADGTGDAVEAFKMPTVSKKQKALIRAEKQIKIGYFGAGLDNLNEWQWQRKPRAEALEQIANGVLLSAPAVKGNLWEQPNMVLKKIKGPDVTYTAQVKFCATDTDDRCGLVVMGRSYSALDIIKEADGTMALRAENGDKAEKGAMPRVSYVDTVPRVSYVDTLPRVSYVDTVQGAVFLRVTIHSEDALPDQGNDDKRVSAVFSYSVDGKHFTEVPAAAFSVAPGKWIGAKVGFYCLSDNPAANMQILSFEEK